MYQIKTQDRWGNALIGAALRLKFSFSQVAHFDGHILTHSFPFTSPTLAETFLGWAEESAPDLVDFLSADGLSYFAISPAPSDSEAWVKLVQEFKQEYAAYL